VIFHERKAEKDFYRPRTVIPGSGHHPVQSPLEQWPQNYSRYRAGTNTVILKPSEKTPLTAILFAELFV